jgi:hypothetical protein
MENYNALKESQLDETRPIMIEPPPVEYLDLKLARSWNTIPFVMNFFTDFTNSQMKNCEEIHKLSIAVSELLENAIKYSDKECIRIKLDKRNKGNIIKLQVTNHTTPRYAKKLMKRIKELNSCDSLTFYLKRMRESVKNKEESAGLGLARVYHESSAILSARYFRLKKSVEVTATITLLDEEE